MSVRHRLGIETDNRIGGASVHITARESEHLPEFSVALHSCTGSQTIYMNREEMTKLRDLITDVLITDQED